MYGNDVVLALTLEAPHIVDVVASAFQALSNQFSLYALQFDVFLWIQVAIKDDNVILVLEASNIYVFLLVVCYCGKAFVFASDFLWQLLYLLA